MLRFLLDENLPVWLAGDLRKSGLDAEDVREIAGPGLEDDEVYRLALRGRRHLVSTNYKDFGNPLRYPPMRQTGIVIVRMPKCSVKTVADHLVRFLTGVEQSELSRTLIILEPSRLRRRRVT